MTLYTTLLQPFADFGHMRRALAACMAISAAGTPLGVFLMLRRMALMGDAISHAILPGVAVAFLISGTALWPMTLGGMAAGLLVATIAGAIARVTPIREDASITGIYLISIALGIAIISMKTDAEELVHLLFGDVTQMRGDSLVMVVAFASISLMALAAIYRSLVVECFDPGFLRSVRGKGAWVHQIFLTLVVLMLVASFQALGTLMALGLMLLPAIAARFWAEDMDKMIGVSILLALVSSYSGLLLSFHAHIPAGSAIVLAAGAIYGVSVLVGSCGGILTRFLPQRHLEG